MRHVVPPFLAVLVGAVLLLPACGDGRAREASPASRAAAPVPVPSGEVLAGRLGCGACHAGAPLDGVAGPLPEADPSLDPAVVYAYLMDPPAPAEGAARMPDFDLSEGEAAALALNVAAGRPGSGGGDRDALRAVIAARPLVASRDVGARVRNALRCDACHTGQPALAAPPLHLAAATVRPEWLRAFLMEPHAVRPLGWRPGSATRMPHFGLSATEVDSLVAWLLPDGAPVPPADVAPLPPRQRAGTLTLMRERWGCMGCHAWNGEGGRIGPDLALAAGRLRPDHVRAMLEDPAAAAPGTIMPRPLLEPRDVDRIVALLVHNDEDGGAWPKPLSVLDPGVYDPATGPDAAAVYHRACAICHGRRGEADGIAASYLQTPPARHADARAMAERPDDTLYDGIAAGGRILGGSPEMPAFGGSLEPALMRALVAHIRTLCACEGPAWSSDGGAR